jgi:hypothetical protein
MSEKSSDVRANIVMQSEQIMDVVSILDTMWKLDAISNYNLLLGIG